MQESWEHSLQGCGGPFPLWRLTGSSHWLSRMRPRSSALCTWLPLAWLSRPSFCFSSSCLPALPSMTASTGQHSIGVTLSGMCLLAPFAPHACLSTAPPPPPPLSFPDFDAQRSVRGVYLPSACSIVLPCCPTKDHSTRWLMYPLANATQVVCASPCPSAAV